MLSLDRRMSFEVEFHRVAIAVTNMLARQMDDRSIELARDAGTDLYHPSQRTAQTASRIVVLCRRLTDEVHRYQHCEQLRREEKEEEIPF